MSTGTCKVEGCGRQRSGTASMCSGHLGRWRRHGDVFADVPLSLRNAGGLARSRELGIDLQSSTTCIEVGCERPQAPHRLQCLMCMEAVAVERNEKRVCSVEGCERPRHQTYALCTAHTLRVRTYGETFPSIPVPAPHGALREAAQS